MWNSKGALNEIYMKLDSGTMDMDRTFETFTSWKKDFIKILKEWDKAYVKHAKSIYPEMSAIHASAMKPLTLLIEANLNFYKLELMI